MMVPIWDDKRKKCFLGVLFLYFDFLVFGVSFFFSSFLLLVGGMKGEE